MTEERHDEPITTEERASEGVSAERDEEIRCLRADLVRLAADFDNYRKQVAREREILAGRAWDEAVLALLPVCDAVERALRAHPDASSGEAKELRDGMERVKGLVEETLRRLGCEGFDSLGQAYDPLYHEVVLAEEADEERNRILAEFERGFVRNGRVLRPAKVKVSLGRQGGVGK